MNLFPQVVFVHGAWADGSCWKELILPLERQGLKVACAPIPLTSLSDDVSALTRALERTSGPIVLVGHAYGGAVIGAIHNARVKSFVYIAALAPDEDVAETFKYYVLMHYAPTPLTSLVITYPGGTSSSVIDSFGNGKSTAKLQCIQDNMAD